MSVITFAEWIEEQLRERGWKQADLARESGLDTGYLSRIINMERRIGPESCVAIANALMLPPDLVFTKAGLLPSKPQDDITREATHLFDQLSDADQETVLIMMRALVRDKVRHATSKAHPQSSQS